MSASPPDLDQVAAALRQVSRGLAALADAISGASQHPEEARYLAVMAEWGRRGLTRDESSRLFRKHGFSPQAAGGWVKGDWLEVRDDGRRYLSDRSLQWLADPEADDEQ
ncbi:hypothetical protein E1281_23870 [Actinomadura sp. KC345]|uniref:hypothetical protein n=1 Tax=Actinomadura sp. KC345 TaxID=2530371 RepID=UPI001049D0C6|nr:hypothetical protein [Actinomadura sp. KC345]TDC49069.1 hypothetical protein E1281_23870 [Actinomadura sp. KC345]